MNRPYTAYSPYSTTATERMRSLADDADTDGFEYSGLREYDPDSDDGYDDDYDGFGAPVDRRWAWIAGAAGVILLVAVVCTVVILGGGDSGSVSTSPSNAATTSQRAAATTEAPAPSAQLPPPAAQLPPETVTTVTPTPSATPSATATASPTASAPAAPPPAPATAVGRTITYRVYGTKPMIDLVTVIYTDQQGALQTEVNVALPWTKTVVLDPGVGLTSVTATSVGGQLNCTITDAAGALITEQTTNSMITTCTR